MTCPDVEEGSETEHMYPVTLVVAFTWLALFSTVLSAVITRWGMLLELPGTIMGMFIVAVGAQIPDTVQAIAVAKRGFGSMAVASAVGSQVMNILIGLGVPWLLSTSVGIPIPIVDTAQLSVMTYLMVACWVVYVAVLLLPTLPTWALRREPEPAAGLHLVRGVRRSRSDLPLLGVGQRSLRARYTTPVPPPPLGEVHAHAVVAGAYKSTCAVAPRATRATL